MLHIYTNSITKISIFCIKYIGEFLLEYAVTTSFKMLDAHITWKPTYTLARLMVGDHQSVKRRFGIWFKPDLWAFVNFLYFMDSSNPEAFSLGSGKKKESEKTITTLFLKAHEKVTN
jgi:hypothetical protein